MAKGKVDKFHVHEALHMSSFLMKAVSEELCEHEFITSKKKLVRLADSAYDALFDLYQEIGKLHLK